MKHLVEKFLHSSSYQVGTVFAALMLLGILFVSYWLVIASGDTLLRESEEAVRSELRGLIAINEAAGPAAMANLVGRRGKQDRASGFFYAMRDVDGTISAGNISSWPGPNVERLKEGLVLFEIGDEVMPGAAQSPRLGSEHLDIIAKIHRFESGVELLVGRNVDDLEIAQFVARTFGWIMILILVLIFALSYGVAYYVASRFERIAATTDRIIKTGNLAERLPVDSTWDDLSQLSVLLNRMLAELELRVDGIKSVSDSIAHDLRTPLMALRARIEERTSGETQAALLEELDGTLGVFQSLLRISAIEAGKQPLSLAPVELDALALDAAALYEPLAAEAKIELRTCASPTTVQGDRDLLFQAIANVLDNAIKFTPAAGEVALTVTGSDTHADITVSDTGPGISPAHRATVMERFRRLDGSRSAPGNGLGLSLAQAIVHRHGGSLSLDAGELIAGTGLRVTITVPRRAMAVGD
ncbi:MAG: HAMP domain-containing sensor histidine kinase [Pseudomonadota bacterium]